jgi:hypothetical protein
MDDLTFYIALGNHTFARGYTQKQALVGWLSADYRREPTTVAVYRANTPDIRVGPHGPQAYAAPGDESAPRLEHVADVEMYADSDRPERSALAAVIGDLAALDLLEWSAALSEADADERAELLDSIAYEADELRYALTRLLEVLGVTSG